MKMRDIVRKFLLFLGFLLYSNNFHFFFFFYLHFYILTLSINHEAIFSLNYLFFGLTTYGCTTYGSAYVVEYVPFLMLSMQTPK